MIGAALGHDDLATHRTVGREVTGFVVLALSDRYSNSDIVTGRRWNKFAIEARASIDSGSG